MPEHAPKLLTVYPGVLTKSLQWRRTLSTPDEVARSLRQLRRWLVFDGVAVNWAAGPGLQSQSRTLESHDETRIS